MIKNNKSRQALVNARRWAAYAAASAATAVATPEVVDAEVWFSGPINLSVRAPSSSLSAEIRVPLHTQSGATLGFGRHFLVGEVGVAQFGVYGRVAGFSDDGYKYALNVPYGAHLTTLRFGAPASYFMTMAFGYGYGNSQFLDSGTGYLAFWFRDIHHHTKYGWARVEMDGGPYHGYTIVDFLYGNHGEIPPVGFYPDPEPESLGLLAIGAIGVLAARAARRKRAKLSAEAPESP